MVSRPLGANGQQFRKFLRVAFHTSLDIDSDVINISKALTSIFLDDLINGSSLKHEEK